MVGPRHRHTGVALVMLALATGLACHDAPTSPTPGRTTAAASVSSDGPKLLKCSPHSAQSASATVGVAGGEVALGANRLVVPGGALSGATVLEVAVPGSSRVQLDLSANGQDHFTFAAPVAITIDLGRCASTDLDGGSLSVWYIDAATGQLLEQMGGSFDAVAKTMTFTTDHFSSYAVAH